MLICLSLLFQDALASGGDRVQTEAQAGPLYRVEGTPLSISCSVSGLDPPPDDRNNFNFRVKKPSMPNFVAHIISTETSDFPYALYMSRVNSGEITVEHVDPNSVVFKILSLQKTDEGEYECSVINTKSTYYGAYSAKTTVKVIDNSLSVSSSAPSSLTQTEGDSVDLSCEVSSSTVQHTHLSFAWFLRRDTEAAARPLISMDREFTLIPGQGFEERYKAGLIRLDKIGEVTYRLKISHLELSDQGALYCEAQEWIQDPDRTWYSIVTKAAGETSLTVKPNEVLSDASSLVVALSVSQSSLQEGQRLSVSCTVNAQNLKEKFFSLAWLRAGVELARVGPTGVLTVGPDYSSREREGELRAARIGDRDYSLVLQPVRTSDQGEYVCRAWPEERSGSGDFTQGAYQDSAPHAVNISATESGLSVEMASMSVNEGNKLELSCRVSGVTGQLSVTWQRQSASSAPFSALISLNQEGVMTKAEGSLDVSVKALRPDPHLFTLELEEATQADAGVYQCVVSEWETTNKASSQVATSIVTVTALESFVRVSLTGRNNQAAEGEQVVLICRVKRLSLPRTLTWSVRRHGSPTPDSILTLYSSGAVSWFGDQQQRYQLKIEEKNPLQNEMWYHLLINSASKSEAGQYQCSVSVVLEKAPRKLTPSNELAVSVERPESDLILSSAPSIRANINADIELKCSVSSNSLMLSRYAVIWLLQQQTEEKIIVRSDQDAFISFGPEVEPNQRQRLSVSRTEGPNFILTIRNTRSSDEGLYRCEVVQWKLDPSQQWHQFPSVSKSTQLTVIEPASDLHLNTTTALLNVKEGDDVELECNLTSVEDSTSFSYKVVWLYSELNTSISKVPLVQLDHTGLLTYPMHEEVQGLQERLQLKRPTQSTFNLAIHTVHEEDRGMYVCRVEQYQLDKDEQWQQKASEEASPVSLHVNVTGNQLFIENADSEFNISTSQSLTIPCHISAQSSPQSQFQVTWFWQKDNNTEPHPLFTAHRNSTLQYWFGKSDEQLRFGHPLPHQFSLAVLRPSLADQGIYFCEVEEWVPSLSRGWRRAGVERSGYLTAQMNAEGGEGSVSEPLCNSPTWIGVFFGVTFLLLLVILLLVVRICRGNAAGKKKESSLWTENHQLNPKN